MADYLVHWTGSGLLPQTKDGAGLLPFLVWIVVPSIPPMAQGSDRANRTEALLPPSTDQTTGT